MEKKIIDCFIELGGEKDALDRCPGFRELYWTGDLPEAKNMVIRVREHFNVPWPGVAPMSVDTLIEDLDRAGITHAVLHGIDFEAKAPWKTKKTWNPVKLRCPADYVKEVVAKNPKRFRGIAGINPLKPRNQVLDEIDRYVNDWGFVGIKLLPFAGYFPNDKDLLYPIYEKCLDLDAVVVIMSSMIGLPGFRLSYVHPLPIDDVAQDFPELKIYILHGGERQVWGYEAVAVCFHSPNVFICTSPLLPDLATGYVRNPDLLRYAAEMIPDQVVFASSYPVAFPIRESLAALDSIEGLTEEFKEKMYYQNAARFFGFD